MASKSSNIASNNELTAVENYIELLQGRPYVQVDQWEWDSKKRVLNIWYEDLNCDLKMGFYEFTFEELLEDGLERI